MLEFLFGGKKAEQPNLEVKPVEVKSYIVMSFPSGIGKYAIYERVNSLFTTSSNAAEALKISQSLARARKDSFMRLDMEYFRFTMFKVGICCDLLTMEQFCILSGGTNYIIALSPYSPEKIVDLIQSGQFHTAFNEVLDYRTFNAARLQQMNNDGEAYAEGRFPDPNIYKYTCYDNPYYLSSISNGGASFSNAVAETRGGIDVSPANHSPSTPICS